MKTCKRCDGTFSRLYKCVICERKVCAGCSWVSGLNGKRVCTMGNCARQNARHAKGCTHPWHEPCAK